MIVPPEYRYRCFITITCKGGEEFLLVIYYRDVGGKPQMWTVHPDYCLRYTYGQCNEKVKGRLILQPRAGLDGDESERALMDLFDFKRKCPVDYKSDGWHDCVCHSEVGRIKWKVKAWR
jgi:hypothetical protein